ncbi:hypothetical protein [Alicyclobacillus macrosporangiidus]|uniref:hypothetical protein n=1 Tax=Alicyclobacillus macrosporangiidus TaxID=392015 RepID=UPI0004951A4B|nr:hypothetical protein [Alicyclobacillus macrosporangiidus]
MWSTSACATATRAPYRPATCLQQPLDKQSIESLKSVGPSDVRVQLAEAYGCDAKQHDEQAEYLQALDSYGQAIELLAKMDEPVYQAWLADCYHNRALAMKVVEGVEAAISDMSRAIDIRTHLCGAGTSNATLLLNLVIALINRGASHTIH